MASSKDFSPFVPFDLYDFFGYLFPGVLFSTNMFIFYNIINPGFYAGWFSTPQNAFDIPFVVSIAIVVGAIVIMYSLGHIIATISHIIIDRVLIDGIEGYPVNFLLRIKRPKRPYSEATFKYLFASFNALLIIPALPLSYPLVLKLIIITISCIGFLIMQRIIIMVVRISPNGHERAHRVGDKNPFKLFLIPARLIIDPAIEFLRKLLGMDRGFSDTFIKLYRELFSARFGGLNSLQENSDNYWLPAFAAISNEEVHDRTLNTWLHLYGFSRNASASLYLSSTLIVGHLIYNPQTFTGLVPLFLGTQWFLASLFGIRYWILYSHYYSKGVIRAFVEYETRKK